MLPRRKGEADSANRRGLARVGEFNVFQFDNRMLQAKVDVLRMLGFRVGFCFLFNGQGKIVEPRYGVEVPLSLCCGNAKASTRGKAPSTKARIQFACPPCIPPKVSVAQHIRAMMAHANIAC